MKDYYERCLRFKRNHMKTTLEEMKLEMENLEKAYHLIDDNVGNYVSVDQIRHSIQLAIVELKGKIDKLES